MIKKLSQYILRYLLHNDVIKDTNDEKEYYQYGIEITISSILNIILILVIGLITWNILDDMYSDESAVFGLLDEQNNDTVISEVSDSVLVADETEEIADQTDIQVMILTENMSAFANEDNISDSTNLMDSAMDTSALDQLLVGTLIE